MGQKGRLGKGLLVLFAGCCFPYIVTLGWTGSINGRGQALERWGGTERLNEEGKMPLDSGRQIILDRETTMYLDVEEYLVGVVARQIPAEYTLEALKAQAVIARTYIYQQMGGKRQIAESALDMDYLGQVQLEKLWGTKNYLEFYQRVEEAIKETRGEVLCWQGEYADALFCRCSAGSTRPGDESHPYLAAVNCPEDLTSDNFLQLKEWTPEEFSRLISAIPDGGPVSADQVPGMIQIGGRDSSGYVTQVQIGNVQFSGDEVRYALGIQSPCFSFEDYGGNIRAEVKGIGHGYGFSQFAANKKAQEGWTYRELLDYFYPGTSLEAEDIAPDALDSSEVDIRQNTDAVNEDR